MVNKYILIPLDLAYMQTVAFILVIASLVQFIEMFLQKAMPALYTALGVYLPLITTNCAVLGVVLLNCLLYTSVEPVSSAQRRSACRRTMGVTSPVGYWWLGEMCSAFAPDRSKADSSTP